MFLFLSRLQIDTEEGCGIFGSLFYFILLEQRNGSILKFIFRVTQGFVFLFSLLLARAFYRENLILQINCLTLSFSSGDEINCFLIHPPRLSFLVVAQIVMYSWTSVSRPRLRTASEGLSCIYSIIGFFYLLGGKKIE